jgi:hypothetical protein
MIRIQSGNTVLQLPRTKVNIEILKSALDAMAPPQPGLESFFGMAAAAAPEKKISAVQPDTKVGRVKGNAPDRDGPT